MGIQVQKKESGGTTYKNLNLSDLEQGEKIECTLKFDQPIEREGQWGPFYSFRVDVTSPFQEEDVSFIAKGRLEDFTTMADELKKYKAGDQVTIFYEKMKKTQKGSYFPIWQVRNAEGKKHMPEILNEQEELVGKMSRKILEENKDTTFTEDSLKELLAKLEVTDEHIVSHIWGVVSAMQSQKK